MSRFPPESSSDAQSLAHRRGNAPSRCRSRTAKRSPMPHPGDHAPRRHHGHDAHRRAGRRAGQACRRRSAHRRASGCRAGGAGRRRGGAAAGGGGPGVSGWRAGPGRGRPVDRDVLGGVDAGRADRGSVAVRGGADDRGRADRRWAQSHARGEGFGADSGGRGAVRVDGGGRRVRGGHDRREPRRAVGHLDHARPRRLRLSGAAIPGVSCRRRGGLCGGRVAGGRGDLRRRRAVVGGGC